MNYIVGGLMIIFNKDLDTMGKKSTDVKRILRLTTTDGIVDLNIVQATAIHIKALRDENS